VGRVKQGTVNVCSVVICSNGMHAVVESYKLQLASSEYQAQMLVACEHHEIDDESE
jgi:hypothetical protein